MKNFTTIVPPADVPPALHEEYVRNYRLITKNSDKLLLFACDQKIEHLNKDFYGEGIHPDAMAPQHLFMLAHQADVGAMAAHLGLIARYGKYYPSVPYIVKLNAKTDLIPGEQQDPHSNFLWSVEDVVALKKSSSLAIAGIGCTVYLGSEYEASMLQAVAHAIFQAHQHGLLAIVWMYPRGKNIVNDMDPELLAGATGVANALGADFVKIKASAHTAGLRLATVAAGNTQVICAGGSLTSAEELFKQLKEQIEVGGTQGAAVGRNIFQRSLPDGVAVAKALQALIAQPLSVADALKLYHENMRKN